MTLTQQNINTLLVLCNKGNQLAQLEVYNRYQQAMYNTALRIVKNTAEAEDVMQESFITASQVLVVMSSGRDRQMYYHSASQISFHIKSWPSDSFLNIKNLSYNIC